MSTHTGVVNDAYASGGYSVHLGGETSGYDINAHNASGLKIDVGDTVKVEQKSAGVWEITTRVTVHPDPVIPDPPPPPAKPTVTVPAAPGSATSVSAVTVPPSSSDPSDSSNAALLEVCQIQDGQINALRNALISLNSSWRPVINTAAADAVAAREAGRTTAQQLSGTVEYAEDTGGAALDAVGDVADANVSAGTAARIEGLSIRALPGGAGNVAGYSVLDGDANNAISLWLEHRVYWTGQIHAALNRMLAYRGMTLCPAIGTAAWDMTSYGGNWSSVVGRWQDNDDWFATALTILRPRIATLWTNEDLGTPAYPSVTFAWSNRGTFAASRDEAAASLRAHHSYYTAGLGSAVVKPIRIANGQA